jgi:hypothetical protein
VRPVLGDGGQHLVVYLAEELGKMAGEMRPISMNLTMISLVT